MNQKMKTMKDSEPIVSSLSDEQKAYLQKVNEAIKYLKAFIPRSEILVVSQNCKGEEGEFFQEKVLKLAELIKAMPKTYETDGQGMKAVAWLHYFKGSADWWITEKDMESEQIQAFGYADLGYGGELGYISIVELLENNVELDLYWEPKPLEQVIKK